MYIREAGKKFSINEIKTFFLDLKKKYGCQNFGGGKKLSKSVTGDLKTKKGKQKKILWPLSTRGGWYGMVWLY